MQPGCLRFYSAAGRLSTPVLLWTWLLLVVVALLIPGRAASQDLSQIGGDLTSDLPAKFALTLPAPNIRSEEFRSLHLDGFVTFNKSFFTEKRNGKAVLGPRFNHDSCEACHVGDGKGAVGFSTSSLGSSMIVKVALRGLSGSGAPRSVPGIGEQLQDHVRGGKRAHAIRLAWREVSRSYPDGTRYTLRRPELNFSLPSLSKARRAQVVSSLRMTPPVIGMGLLEAIPDATLETLADPNDTNGDGISGEVNLVPNLETNSFSIGRFGFRASHPTVRQQSAAAFFHDMGLTNALFSAARTQQEISELELVNTTFYLQAAGVPRARDQDNPDVVAGKALFQQVGCANCHVMTLATGESAVEEVANQSFHPFTDLLLHDMGPDLADRRAEFRASGREWRTTPLWGLGILEELSTVSPRYLHDGRARTIEEAILWHGGEARRSRDAFKALPRAQRLQLLRFLRSL